MTEELWGYLKAACQENPVYTPKQGWEEALIVAAWPQDRPLEGWEEGRINDFGLIQEIVRAIRNERVEKKVTAGKRIPAVLAAAERRALLAGQVRAIAALAYLDPDRLQILDRWAEKPQGLTGLVVGGVEIYLPLEDVVDAEAERNRLQKELADIEAQITRLETLLGSSFAGKAPAAVVEKERQRLAAAQETAAKLRDQLAHLG